MSSTNSEQGLIKILSGAVVLTGGLVALSLLATNPQEDDPASLAAIARAPANLVGMALSAEKAALPNLERTTVLDLGCQLPTTAEISAEVRQLRLSAKTCDLGNVRDTEVTNLTNGFSATVFQMNVGQFTSDYIHLADGANRLRITYVQESGERINREFTVVRSESNPTLSK